MSPPPNPPTWPAPTSTIEDTATPTEAEPTITQPPRSQRGNVIMQIGETAYLTMSQTDLTPFVEFQVTEIAVSPQCPGAEPPENGNFVTVSLNISTATTWPPDMEGIPLIFHHYWSVVGEDGITESALTTAAIHSCLDESELHRAAASAPARTWTASWCWIPSPRPGAGLQALVQPWRWLGVDLLSA